MEDFRSGDPSIMLDFFDFLLIGFVLAFFVRDWHLTYGQSAVILFSSGVAAVPGAIFFGWLGDKIGRRKVFMITVLMFSFATGAMALTPDRGWVYLTVMRFIVGVGVVGVAAVDMPLLQEFVPAAKRGWISGLSIALVPGGGLLAATFAAYLGAVIGWRGLFALGLHDCWSPGRAEPDRRGRTGALDGHAANAGDPQPRPRSW